LRAVASDGLGIDDVFAGGCLQMDVLPGSAIPLSAVMSQYKQTRKRHIFTENRIKVGKWK
jgi:hypothetical protein